jgi:hypothetical protein
VEEELEPSDARPDPRPPTFSTVIAQAWRLYTANLGTLFLLFALIALVMTAVPALLIFDIADGMALPLYLLLAVVLPAVLASIGFGITALLLWDRDKPRIDAEAHPLTIRGAFNSLGRFKKELLASALLAGMIDLALAAFLGLLGLLLVGLFYGPPILVQVVTIERMSLQEAWPRAKELLRGRTPRVFLYLLAVALGTSLLSAVTLNILAAVTEGLPDVANYLVLSVLQILAVGLTVPLLACASYVCYRELRAEKDFTGGSPTPG